MPLANGDLSPSRLGFGSAIVVAIVPRGITKKRSEPLLKNVAPPRRFWLHQAGFVPDGFADMDVL